MDISELMDKTIKVGATALGPVYTFGSGFCSYAWMEYTDKVARHNLNDQFQSFLHQNIITLDQAMIGIFGIGIVFGVTATYKGAKGLYSDLIN